MKNKSAIFNIFIISLLVVGLFAGCAKNTQKVTETGTDSNETKTTETKNTDVSKETDSSSDKLIMGTNAEFPPFESMENGEIVGFDVDLAKAIAEKLGKELEIQNMNFDGLVAACQNKKVDFVAAGMTADDERKKSVNFSEPYFDATQVIVVNVDNETIKGKDDLVGKKLGVQLGTTSEKVAKEVEDAKVQSYDASYSAIMNLVNNKLDAVVMDKEPAKNFVEKNDKIIMLEEGLSVEQYAIAINKEDEELLKQVNEVIKELKENGTYDELCNKYFGIEE